MKLVLCKCVSLCEERGVTILLVPKIKIIQRIKITKIQHKTTFPGHKQYSILKSVQLILSRFPREEPVLRKFEQSLISKSTSNLSKFSNVALFHVLFKLSDVHVLSQLAIHDSGCQKLFAHVTGTACIK